MNPPAPDPPRRTRARPARPLSPTLFLWALLVLWPAVAAATEGGYQPYRPESVETVSAPLLVVIAYSAILAVLLGFVALLFSRQRRMAREIEEIERKLSAGASAPKRSE